MLVLYNPPSSARRKPVMPLSLLALGALLEGRHEYTIVDGNLDPRPIDTLDRLVREHFAHRDDAEPVSMQELLKRARSQMDVVIHDTRNEDSSKIFRKAPFA